MRALNTRELNHMEVQPLRTIVASLVLIALHGAGPAFADSLWPVNGHRYRPVTVPEGITWDQANAAAIAAEGYLATCTSSAENDFVFSLVNAPQFWTGSGGYANWGPWLGAYRPQGSVEPAGAWRWVTQEPLEVHTPGDRAAQRAVPRAHCQGGRVLAISACFRRICPVFIAAWPLKAITQGPSRSSMKASEHQLIWRRTSFLLSCGWNGFQYNVVSSAWSNDCEAVVSRGLTPFQNNTGGFGPGDSIILDSGIHFALSARGGAPSSAVGGEIVRMAIGLLISDIGETLLSVNSRLSALEMLCSWAWNKCSWGRIATR